jgi:hypothetical protein
MADIEPIYHEITQKRTDKPWSKTFPLLLKKLMTIKARPLSDQVSAL